MSETPKQAGAETTSNREIIHRKTAIFEQYLSPLHADVYKATINCFPEFHFLRDMSVVLDRDSDILAGGTVNGEPSLHIGLKEGVITPRMRSRVMERFQLRPDLLGMELELQDTIAKAITFGHELGHAIQEDPLFERFYGRLEGEHLNPHKGDDYVAYVNSDWEVNADFIAAEILGHTKLGEMLGFMPPTEGPSEWRAWGEQHPVPQTIAMTSSN